MMAYKKIVDISTFDKTVDFKKVKDAGYAGVIIRAGYGQTNVDAYFREHIQGANEIDFPAGIYWFSYAYSVEMAKKEALKCLEVIKPYKITLPVYWDYEYDSDNYAKGRGRSVSNLLLNQMAVSFCSEIRKAGYIPGIYFNKDFRDNRFSKEVLKSYSMWYAYYNKTLDSDAEGVDLWQYTSTGDVPGIPEKNEDINNLLNEKLLDGMTIIQNDGSVLDSSKAGKYTKSLQKALNKSYKLSLPVDGYFGKMTESAVTIHYLYYTKPCIKNEHVKWLQEMLNTSGFMTAIDGSFGPDTRKMLKKYQAKSRLVVDGFAGPATHKALLEGIK